MSKRESLLNDVKTGDVIVHWPTKKEYKILGVCDEIIFLGDIAGHHVSTGSKKDYPQHVPQSIIAAGLDVDRLLKEGE